MRKPRFNIRIERNLWDCGDGCCSDSGYTSNCFDSKEEKNIYEKDDWSHNHYWGWMKKEILEKIQEILGYDPVENVDYYINYWVVDTKTQNVYDGYYKDDFEYWEKV